MSEDGTTITGRRYQHPMPAVDKGLTREFRARTDETEYDIITRLVDQFKELGTTISRNDVLRLLIRNGPPRALPTDLATGRCAIEAHCSSCPWCEENRIGCPWGRSLKEAYDRLQIAAGVQPVPAPAERPAPTAGAVAAHLRAFG